MIFLLILTCVDLQITEVRVLGSEPIDRKESGGYVPGCMELVKEKPTDITEIEFDKEFNWIWY